MSMEEVADQFIGLFESLALASSLARHEPATKHRTKPATITSEPVCILPALLTSRARSLVGAGQFRRQAQGPAGPPHRSVAAA